VTAEQRPPIAPQQFQRHRYTALRSPLWLCLLVALLIRVWLTYHTHGVIDGDEAMVGIQAQHILRGEHPVYYYGQHYMGSLEAYLMAVLFAIAGPSVWMLRAEPILLSLVVVWLTWKFAGVLANTAQLTSSAQQVFKTLATLCAAVSPLYDTVLELRTLGGYIETFVLMLCLLLAAFQLTRRWQAGAANKELAWRWAVIGFIVGLGFWVDQLIVSTVLAATLWIGGFCLGRFRSIVGAPLAGALGWGGETLGWGGEQVTLGGKAHAFLKSFWFATIAIPACLLGAAPAVVWGATHKWTNFIYVLQLGSIKTINVDLRPRYTSQFALIRDQTYLYKTYVAPRVISGALPIESSLLTAMHTFALWIGLFCIVATLALIALSLVWHHPELKRMRQLCGLPLLFALCTAFTFCTSTASSAGLISFQYDLAGRYATPLMLALPFFFATTFTLAYMYIHKLGRKVCPPLALVILFALLFAYLGTQVATYALTDPDATYQSPSCPIAPANNDPIIAYLQHEHVHYAWAITWIGNPIIFKTNDGIILSDPRLIINRFINYHDPGRYPAYTKALLHADRPAMLTLVMHQDTYPMLLRLLDSRHVTYKARRFPSEPGYDVLVVTSLSRTLPIEATHTFTAAFPGCI